jgi:hypothetical protein
MDPSPVGRDQDHDGLVNTPTKNKIHQCGVVAYTIMMPPGSGFHLAIFVGG